MYNALNAKLFQDSNDPVGPKPYASPYTFIYFLLFMSIMTLVLLNMFIGFVIVTFQEVGIKAFRESKLDRNQVGKKVLSTVLSRITVMFEDREWILTKLPNSLLESNLEYSTVDVSAV